MFTLLMKYTKLHYLTVAGLLLMAMSCKNDENFAPTPKLEWRSGAFMNDEDTLSQRRFVELTVYFTDGDGNIGHFENEEVQNSCDANEYDLLIRYFEQTNGMYQEEPYDTTIIPVFNDRGQVVDSTFECLTYHVILPDLMPEGQNKNLEGEIITDFDYSGFPRNPNADSIRFEIQLLDRDRNRSNIVISPAVAIP